MNKKYNDYAELKPIAGHINGIYFRGMMQATVLVLLSQSNVEIESGRSHAFNYTLKEEHKKGFTSFYLPKADIHLDAIFLSTYYMEAYEKRVERCTAFNKALGDRYYFISNKHCPKLPIHYIDHLVSTGLVDLTDSGQRALTTMLSNCITNFDIKDYKIPTLPTKFLERYQEKLLTVNTIKDYIEKEN